MYLLGIDRTVHAGVDGGSLEGRSLRGGSLAGGSWGGSIGVSGTFGGGSLECD